MDQGGHDDHEGGDRCNPPSFDAYATIELPGDWQQEQGEHDAALVDLLVAHSRSQSWWLRYLDTGADDIVFSDVPKLSLYAGWSYVLVQAGPDQAMRWRKGDTGTFWKGALPDLMFPTDRSWLSSTLWDDDWTCVGGAAVLIDELLQHPVLGARSRAVVVGEDATPPGHRAI